MHEEVTPVGTYFWVFVSLMVLAAATFGVSFVDLGRLNLLIALVIAFTKAVLVVLFFMEMRRATGMMRVAFLAGLMWLGILVVGTMVDFVSRGFVAGHLVLP